ncbi:hypothetical protein RRG08_013952 [Elysia crispata]|uniref:PH domain-containing protein n=1 Tax=Elysia crispata TaxID=231223 RepID=A0AAE1AF82_9GAST|nr:hypothetical protein RRG08_013952 [Elysia crispata]
MSDDDEIGSSLSAGKGSNSGYSSGADTDDFLGSFDCAEDELLYVSRHGKRSRLLSMLVSSEEADEGDKLNINCKGNQKSNRGWSPLHLAVYFGQTSSVRLLLEFGASVNQLNSVGESPLHLAAYTGREEIVSLLLQHGADTTLYNTAGQTAKSIARSEYIENMIAAADSTAILRTGFNFQELAASGNAEALSALLSESKGLNINCEDHHGNTALHLAAMRDHCAVAVILLQHGINTQHKNIAGLTALDLSQSEKMRQVLAVQPIQTLHSQPQRFEGFLLKKSRFVGFKQVWVVLERGVLSYFLNRGDASTGSKRKGMKFLDEARVTQTGENRAELRLQYSDGIKHTLQVVEPGGSSHMGVQKWLNALREHIAYSTHYIHKGEGIVDESDDDLIVSLGTMKDSLQNAQAHQSHLEKQVSALVDSVGNMSRSQVRPLSDPGDLPNGKMSAPLKKRDSIKSNKSNSRKSSSSSSSSPPVAPASLPGSSWQSVRPGDLVIIASQANDIVRSSREMCHALNHCMALLSQQEEVSSSPGVCRRRRVGALVSHADIDDRFLIFDDRRGALQRGSNITSHPSGSKGSRIVGLIDVRGKLRDKRRSAVISHLAQSSFCPEFVAFLACPSVMLCYMIYDYNYHRELVAFLACPSVMLCYMPGERCTSTSYMYTARMYHLQTFTG